MNKNYFFFTAIFALFAMAFVSCLTSNHLGDEYYLTEPIEVNLRANINPTTRVANDQWQAGDQIGLFMVHAGQHLSFTSIANDNLNVRMTVQNGVLTSDQPVMYPTGSNSNVDIIAYYPFRNDLCFWHHGNINFWDISVADQKTGLPTEILFSNNITNQAPTPNPVTLYFRHLLAKLDITVTSSTNAVNFQNTAVSVTIEGMPVHGRLALSDGWLSAFNIQPITMYHTGSTATSASFAALVLPNKGDITFLFDVDGVVHRHTMAADIIAANLYRLNFELDFHSFPEPTATLLNAVIIPREVNSQDISVTPSVVINGVRWATRNVGAPGTFVDNIEDAGMFFQWNRRQGWTVDVTGSVTNVTGWNHSAPTGTEWESVNDPCPEGWRMPTGAELLSLRNAESSWITYNGVNGRLFGTAPHQLFLPTAGFLAVNPNSGSGGLAGLGYEGGYWLRHLTPTGFGQHETRFFATGIFGGIYFSTPPDALFFGKNVRCVAK